MLFSRAENIADSRLDELLGLQNSVIKFFENSTMKLDTTVDTLPSIKPNRRYQWNGMYEDVVKFMKSCEACQKRSQNRQEESLHPTWIKIVWVKIGVDFVKLPTSSEGHKYAVFAWDYLTGSEGRALIEADSKSVVKFLFEDNICRYGFPRGAVRTRMSLMLY
jgi:hypothetical protein